MSTPNLSYSQSSDGKTLTFSDDTVYDDPITNYVRTVELYTSLNATGTLLATLTFLGSNLTVDYNITADSYISAKLVHVGSPSMASKIINFTTSRFEYNALFTASKKNCNCVSKKCSPIVYGFIDTYLAQVATDFGNSGLANNFITSASKWLQSNK